MKILRATALLALLVSPAFAEDNHIQRYGEEDKEKTKAELDAAKAADRAYKNSLGNIPDNGAASDPWGGARTVATPKEPPKAGVKTAVKTTAPAKPVKPAATPAQ